MDASELIDSRLQLGPADKRPREVANFVRVEHHGPGESKHASLGISLPGTFEEPKAPVYVDGRLFTTLKGDRIVAEFFQILDDYVESHYAPRVEVKV